MVELLPTAVWIMPSPDKTKNYDYTLRGFLKLGYSILFAFNSDFIPLNL